MEEEYGKLVVYVYITSLINGPKMEKRVSVLTHNNLTKKEAVAAYEAFKKDNEHVNGTFCLWYPSCHFIA